MPSIKLRKYSVLWRPGIADSLIENNENFIKSGLVRRKSCDCNICGANTKKE